MALIHTEFWLFVGLLIGPGIGARWLMLVLPIEKPFLANSLSVCVCFYWGIVTMKALGSFLILYPWVSTFSLHLQGGKLFGTG